MARMALSRGSMTTAAPRNPARPAWAARSTPASSVVRTSAGGTKGRSWMTRGAGRRPRPRGARPCGPRAPSPARPRGRRRADAVARARELVGARGQLGGGVFARVAHDVGGGGAEGMGAALLEPEHGAGHGLHEARRLLHALVGHDAHGHALAGAEGAGEGRLHGLARVTEGDEGVHDHGLVAHEPAVEADDALVARDREGLATAVEDGPAARAAHRAPQFAPVGERGVQDGGRPAHARLAVGTAREGQRDGVVQRPEPRRLQPHAQDGLTRIGAFERDVDALGGGFRAEGGMGVGERRRGRGRARLRAEQGVQGGGVPLPPGGGVAFGHLAGRRRDGGGDGRFGGGGRIIVPDARSARPPRRPPRGRPPAPKP